MWDLGAAHEQELGRHEDPVRDVAWSPDGQMLASASEDGTCKVWTIKGKQTSSKDFQFGVPLWKVSWNEGSFLLAISGGDGECHVMCHSAGDEWTEMPLPECGAAPE